MHSYPGKLLELLTVDREPTDPFIGVRLTCDQPIELRWSLDQETADQMNKVMKAAGSYKYRLSLRSFWNASQQSYYSHLTRSYRDQSEMVYFSCSEVYVRQLQSVKEMESLLDLPALSPFLTSLNKPAPVMEKECKLTISSRNRSLRAPVRMSIVLVGVFIALLSNCPHYLHKNVFANVPPSSVVVYAMPVGASRFDQEKPSVIGLPASEQQRLSAGVPVTEQAELSPDGQTASEKAKLSTDSTNGSEQPKLPVLSTEPTPCEDQVPTEDTSVPATVHAIRLDKLVNFTLPATAVALTFDDGPSKYTKDLVDTLNANKVGGTFFFVGMNVKKFPDAVKYVHSNGYSIGDHSMTHPDFTMLSPSQQVLEINQTREIIERLTTQPVTLFRPPYGTNNKATLDILQALHMRMVLWNRDTEDWKTKNAEVTLKYVQDSKAPGAIFLLHESKETLEALPKIISYLKNQGFQIVNLR